MTLLPLRPSLATAVLIASASLAAASARLTTAAPAPGATVAAAPTVLRFSFDGAVRQKPTAVTLTGPAGKIPLSAAGLDPGDAKVLVVPIAGPLTPGTYKVDWHATGADGHRASGSYAFTIIP